MSIDISNLYFSYGDNTIFENLNLHLPDTGFVVILGSSGSGKTTFLSLLNGFLRQNEGDIIIDRNSLSMVFQSPLLLNYLTVEENVNLVNRLLDDQSEERRKESQENMKRLSLDHLKDKYPYQLSGGEMVRVSICRALAKGSKTLILDEPTGQLDETNSATIYSILKELSKDHLIIMVTHDEINAIRIADYIYRLEKKTLKKEKGNQFHTPYREQKIPVEEKNMRLRDAIYLNRKFLLRKKFRTFFSVLFLSFNLTLIYLGLNLNFHMDETMADLSRQYYSHDVFSMSMEEEIASAGSLHLKKKSIPDDEILSILYLRESYYSLDYFIPSVNEVTVKNKSVSVSFYPSIRPDGSNLKCGKASTKSDEVIVNQSFLNEFQIDEKTALNSSFAFSRETLLYSTSFEATDPVILDYQFHITGISKELKAFNKAIVYYNYESILSDMKKISLPGISDELGLETNLHDMISDAKYDNDDFKSSMLYIRHSEPGKIKESCTALFKKKVSISSPSLDVEESTKEIISNLLKVLTLFLSLNTLVSTMLLFLTVYSFYQDNIRLFALIKAFTRKKRNLFTCAMSMQVIFLLLCMLSTFLFSFFFSILINQFLQRMDYPSFLSVIDMKSHILIILISMAVSLFSCLLPLRKIKDNMISKELEGED